MITIDTNVELNGSSVIIGNSSSDTLKITSQLTDNIAFVKAASHVIEVVGSSGVNEHAGSLVIRAGAAGTGNANGGTVYIVASHKSGTGITGGIGIGSLSSSGESITIGNLTDTTQAFLRAGVLELLGTGANGQSGDVYISSTAASGNVYLDSPGTVQLKQSSATWLQIADTELTINGAASGNLVRLGNNQGDVEIGRVAGGTTSVFGDTNLTSAIITQHVTFKKHSNHTIQVQDSTADNGGSILIVAGKASTGNDGGNLTLDAGLGGAVAGMVNIGTDNARAVNLTKSGGKLGAFGVPASVRQDTVEAVTNNITAGGTSGTLTDWNDLVLYSNDAAAIRNAVYQLGRKVKQLDDALFNYGIVKHS